jgi:RNA polymerase sigma-70 factor (ECF subfamily)
MLGRADLAEDVLQDTFVTIWERAAHYDPTLGSAVAWMTTIARHRAIDRLRIAGREVQADPDRPFETDANLASKAINIGESFAVRRALRELSDDHRHAVMLTYSYGYTHEELAERLGVPLGTAKSWVRRGLQAMKESLAS